MVITQDTNDFGMSKLELRYIGICLIICCAGLTIMPLFWFYTSCKKGEIFFSSSRSFKYRQENAFDEEEIPKGGLSRGIPPRNLNLDNRDNLAANVEDVDSGRQQNLSKLSKSIKQVNKKYTNKGEYESYYK